MRVSIARIVNSYDNTIGLRDEPDVITKKIRTMPTDPARREAHRPGDPEKCPVGNCTCVFGRAAQKVGAGRLPQRRHRLASNASSRHRGVLAELKPIASARSAIWTTRPCAQHIADGGEKTRKKLAEETSATCAARWARLRLSPAAGVCRRTEKKRLRIRGSRANRAKMPHAEFMRRRAH